MQFTSTTDKTDANFYVGSLNIFAENANVAVALEGILGTAESETAVDKTSIIALLLSSSSHVEDLFTLSVQFFTTTTHVLLTNSIFKPATYSTKRTH